MAKVDLYHDFREFLRSLNSANVKYLVVGGYAVNHYGYHRTTDDLDIWIATDAANSAKISKVLQAFGGFPASAVKPSMFQAHRSVFMFGREPVRIDILTNPDGLEFESSYAARNETLWDGIKVPLLSLEHLKQNKQASARPKDLADLENLPAPKIKPISGAAKRRRPRRNSK